MIKNNCMPGRKPKIPFSAKLGAKICVRLMDGESLTKICKDDEFPAREQVLRWLASPHSKFKKFQAAHDRARLISYQVMADEIFDIVDDGTNDWVERFKKGIDGEPEAYMAFDNEHFQRSRLRVDARKWFLSKVLPKIYGDKVQVDQTGTVEHRHTTADDIDFNKIQQRVADTKPEKQVH